MLTLLIGCVFLLCLCLCAAEIYHERDWPRHTYRYAVGFGLIAALSFFMGL